MKRAFPLSLFLLAGCVPDERPADPKGTPPTPATASVARPVATKRELPAGGPSAVADRAAAPEHDLVLTAEFTDHFDRAAIGLDYDVTSAAWRIDGGRLCVEHAKNHPVWLRRKIPVNARIEFDATSTSEDGDLKAEYWGDGKSAAETVSYTAATSYLTIFGGWKNQFHVLARIDEHAPDRPQLKIEPGSDDPRARRVAAGQSYHFKVLRDDGKTVRWFVDDLEILTYPDRDPLAGPGHDHFAFNDWDVHACFDNLVVAPIK